MRYALVNRNHHCETSKTLEAYLPGNYEVVREAPDAFVIAGEDNAGWTLGEYVLPRLASGLITAREITQLEAATSFTPGEIAEQKL